MPSINEIYPSTFLKGEDIPLGRQVKLTIANAELKTLGQGDEAERKVVLSFKRTEKQLPLNKTNALAIKDQYGDDTDDWIGADIWVYRAEVTAFGKRQDVVRVTAKAPAAPAPAKSKAAPQPEVNFDRGAPAGDNPFDDDDDGAAPSKDIPF